MLQVFNASPFDQAETPTIPGDAIQRRIVQWVLPHRAHVHFAGNPVDAIENAPVGYRHNAFAEPVMRCDGLQRLPRARKEVAQRLTPFRKRESGSRLRQRR